MTLSSPLLTSLAVGDEVHWTDPGDGVSSGLYTVTSIESESGTIEAEDTIVWLRNEAGSEAQVFARELD